MYFRYTRHKGGTPELKVSFFILMLLIYKWVFFPKSSASIPIYKNLRKVCFSSL
jgi:hypothetical protein